jgi:hypothetical protein|tara:strand:+ start:20831 stop:21418 length:588 start_codon:yes stop_codon:yes gene_type:complete
MGKFWKAVRAAIGVLMRSSTWVWKRCADTGRMIGRLVLSPANGLGASAAMPVDSPMTENQERNNRELTEELRRMEAVKIMAAEILGDCVKPEHAKSVSPKVMAWLSVLDRKALARVTCADPRALAAHIRGQQCIAGVTPADPDSVEQVRASYEMKLREVPHKEMESKLKTDALLVMDLKLLEMNPDNPYRPTFGI